MMTWHADTKTLCVMGGTTEATAVPFPDNDSVTLGSPGTLTGVPVEYVSVPSGGLKILFLQDARLVIHGYVYVQLTNSLFNTPYVLQFSEESQMVMDPGSKIVGNTTVSTASYPTIGVEDRDTPFIANFSGTSGRAIACQSLEGRS